MSKAIFYKADEAKLIVTSEDSYLLQNLPALTTGPQQRLR